MAKIRIGFSTHFEVENELVGIGTDNPTNTKQVLGNIHATNAKAIGVSTLATYQGFLDKEAKISNNIDINSQAGTLGEVVIDGDVIVSSGSTLCSGVDELSLTDSFSVPTGNTDSRIHCQTAGSMRFNEDLGTLEFYTGDEWRTVNSFKDTGNRGRGVFGGGGGSPAPSSAIIQYVNIATTGNALDFGFLLSTEKYLHGCASSTRGIFGAGNDNDTLQYITIASEGDSIDFGNLTGNALAGSMLSSSTRGIIHQSTNPTTNVISFIEISTIGNALDFGDMTQGVRHGSQFASPTRGVFAGGYRNPQNENYTEFQSVTIASKGNSINFGNLSVVRRGQAGFSNSVRGIQGGGISNAVVTSIESLTIASGGDETVFGDLSLARRLEGGGCASQTRGIFAGGYSPDTNVTEFITIASTGKAQDFGDLSDVGMVAGLSDSHGGLGGF